MWEHAQDTINTNQVHKRTTNMQTEIAMHERAANPHLRNLLSTIEA
jgi:hypothetical protein